MPAIEIEITRREPYAGGEEFGATGAYQRIDGTVTFAVDPNHEANRPIVDLELAPVDASGRVRFRSDFVIVTPQEPARGNGSLIVDVTNRGRHRVIPTFNRQEQPSPRELPPGDGFLFHHGYSVVSIGWQWDVHRDDGLLAIDAPLAQVDGQSVRGQAVVEIRPSAVEHTRLLANRTHRPYPVADPDDPSARLLVRAWEDGPESEVPRAAWRFACETADGVVPSDRHIYFEEGFQPGKIYRVVYTATEAWVVGTGLLAVREIASFLRTPSELNPCEAGFDRAYAWGFSQTARLLRHFIYLGLNLDEAGQVAFDGMLVHVAGGRRGEFNHRFAQPSQQSEPGFGQIFPFADEPLTDPLTGQTAGLLDRTRALGAMPRMIYTNSSAEYWRGDGALVHVDPAGQRDLEPAPETRIYHFAGTQHSAGLLPQHRDGVEGVRGRYGSNVVDYRPLLRAALQHLDSWVMDGVEPPPSRHPRIDDGTAVDRVRVLDRLPLPGFATPDPERLWVLRTIDLGPDADHGIGRYPVVEGATYAAPVSDIDDTGNEVAGIRLPDLSVPVATHLGWNPRDPETGAPEQIIPMLGSSHFFAPTRANREAAGDPRPSIEERYASREDYLAQVHAAVDRLVTERYLLPEDIDIVVRACAERYDLAMSATLGAGTE